MLKIFNYRSCDGEYQKRFTTKPFKHRLYKVLEHFTAAFLTPYFITMMLHWYSFVTNSDCSQYGKSTEDQVMSGNQGFQASNQRVQFNKNQTQEAADCKKLLILEVNEGKLKSHHQVYMIFVKLQTTFNE
uniref:Uncharacterized protein n=1 Tax=Glossina brevipalpis TaxID=37001 RepID=A0A1A9X2T0_9MUSC